MKQHLVALFGLGILLSATAHAVPWSNQFAQFELPAGWQCNLEGAEWVCQNVAENKKRDAIIVLAAKLKGDQDSLDQYKSYLTSPKMYTSVQGKPVKSKMKKTSFANVNNQQWVDSLHFESEIPGFYTRYLATVKDDIGVLVTYSVSQAKYKDYLSTFDNLVQTLKVFRKAGAPINALPAANPLLGNSNVDMAAAVGENTVFPGINPTGAAEAPQAPAPKQDNTMIIIIVVAAAAGLFILKKRRDG